MYICVLTTGGHLLAHRRRSLFHRQRTDTAVAIPVGVADRPVVQVIHILDGRRLGVQTDRSGRGGSPVGRAQKQTENELRKA